MVDYTDQEEVRRWLEAQAADPAKRGNVVFFAVRCALRVLPLVQSTIPLGNDIREAINDWASVIALPVFRGVASSWAVAKNTTQNAKLGVESYAACYAAARASDAAYAAVGDVPKAGVTAPDAAEHAARAAYAFSASTADPADSHGAYAATAASADTYAIRATSVAMNSAYASAELVSSLKSDIAELNRGVSRSHLAMSPLWPMSIPDRVGADWDSLRDALLSRNEDWDVWTNWYSARLRGRVTYSHLTAKQNEEIEVARVLEIIEDDWKQGPAHVNAKVRQIEARYHSRNAPEEPDDLPPEPAKPISIEPPRPSAIEPEWNDGRLVLPKGAAASGTPAESLSAALSTLHKALQKLADDTRGLNNADPRFAGFLDSLLADFPNEAPSQEDLFRTGHAQTVLDAYAATVSAEWPNLLAAEYQATLLTFRRTVRQFDKWRDFVEAAEGQSLDGGEIVEAVQTAKSLETILQTEEAEDFVAPEIPEALSEIAGAIEHADGFDPIEAGKEDLAKDLLNGIDNIVQRIAEAALTEYIRDVGGDYLKGVSEGFRKSLKDMSEKDGERLAKWSRRVLIAGATSYGAWLAGISPIARIAQKFPEIAHWLEPIIRFLIG